MSFCSLLTKLFLYGSHMNQDRWTAHCCSLLQSCRQRAQLLTLLTQHDSFSEELPLAHISVHRKKLQFSRVKRVAKLIIGYQIITKLSARENKHSHPGTSIGADLIAQECSQLCHANSPVQVLLHHFCHGSGNSSFMWTEVFIQIHSKFLFQEINNELGARYLSVIVFNPRHFPLRGKFSIKIVLRKIKASKQTDTQTKKGLSGYVSMWIKLLKYFSVFLKATLSNKLLVCFGLVFKLILCTSSSCSNQSSCSDCL